MKRLPSTSSMYAPDARRMKSGASPTALNARTGLSTPPGSTACARAKNIEDRLVFVGHALRLQHQRPRQRHPRLSGADRRQQPDRQADGFGHVARRDDLEDPDTRLHAKDVPAALGIGLRRERALAGERPGRIAIK